MSREYRFPENTDTELYISSQYTTTSLDDILSTAQNKWGDDINLEDISIEAKNIQTSGCSCCYDPSDYDLYLLITHESDSAK